MKLLLLFVYSVALSKASFLSLFQARSNAQLAEMSPIQQPWTPQPLQSESQLNPFPYQQSTPIQSFPRFKQDEQDDDEIVSKQLKTVELDTRDKKKEDGEGQENFQDDISAEDKPFLGVDNPDFYLQNINNHKLDVDDRCELKRAFLYVVNDDFERTASQDDNDEGNRMQKGKKFHGNFMFLVLNKLTLAFYESSDLKNLHDVYHSVNIERNPFETVIPNRYCFYINFVRHTRQMQTYEKENQNDQPYRQSIICASNQKDMYRWIDLINEFKHCDEKKVEDVKEKEDREKEVQEDIQDDPVDFNPDFLEMQNVFKLKEQTRKMVKRKKLEEIQIMQKKLDKIREQKKCLEDSLKQKEALEREANEQMLSSEKQNLMRERLKKAMEDIENIEENEEQQEENAEDGIKQEQQRLIEKEAQDMVEMAFESQKLMDPSACYASDQLVFPSFDLFQQKACGQLFLSYDDKGVVTHDIIMYQKCRAPKQFCEICCNQFIGKSHFSQRQLCKLRCQEYQDAYSNDYNIDIPFSANLKIDPSKLFDPNAKGITNKQSQEQKDKIAQNILNAKEKEDKKQKENKEENKDQNKENNKKESRLSQQQMLGLNDSQIEEQLALLKHKLQMNGLQSQSQSD